MPVLAKAADKAASGEQPALGPSVGQVAAGQVQAAAGSGANEASARPALAELKSCAATSAGMGRKKVLVVSDTGVAECEGSDQFCCGDFDLIEFKCSSESGDVGADHVWLELSAALRQKVYYSVLFMPPMDTSKMHIESTNAFYTCHSTYKHWKPSHNPTTRQASMKTSRPP